ncbi:hypothetical protein [uncultured Croceitalea sp.]|uniref:hypothetical protein n=1 Tax=uncultured Croceitalea sp. TaxID=1798908 RepID=UPI0033059ADD
MYATKLKVFLVFSIMSLGIAHYGFGQQDYEEGYIVTDKNDTVYGQVSDRKTGPFSKIYKRIRFRGKGLKKQFSPKKILAYKKGGETFRSMLLDGENHFFKVISKGYVSHYVYELQEQGEQLVQEIDYLQKQGNGDLVRATQGILGIKRKKLAQLFYDCPKLVEKINNKDLKSVSEIVTFYNLWKKEGS